jgi:Na+/phosphate symporter
MALAVTLATSGAMPVTAVLPVIFGAHAGSSVTVLIAGLSGKQNARKLGICTFVYKVLGVLILLPALPWLQGLLSGAAGGLAGKIVLAQVGVTLFNALVFYPFADALARFSGAIAERTGRERLAAPVYLDEDLLEIPSLAILLLSKEMIRLANYIEMYCQVLFVSAPNGDKTFQELPGAIRELSEACEEYMYGIHIPSDDVSSENLLHGVLFHGILPSDGENSFRGTAASCRSRSGRAARQGAREDHLGRAHQGGHDGYPACPEGLRPGGRGFRRRCREI